MNTKIIKVIWLALTLSQFLYGFIVYISPAPANAPIGQPLPLWAPAIVSGLISVGIFSSRLTGSALERLFSQTPAKVAFGRVFVLYIICWAMNESITLFGFVTAFTFTHTIDGFIPFAAAGVALNVVMFPRLDRFVQQALSREGGSISPT